MLKSEFKKDPKQVLRARCLKAQDTSLRNSRKLKFLTISKFSMTARISSVV
jgi:hypothetical protein